mmetsp:Transcript_33014/g.60517  ORF Transcript_33014/g.60517 Transcript_33014/m.60517 type:complete len:300 (+) Transcript_33014:96-995(+)
MAAVMDWDRLVYPGVDTMKGFWTVSLAWAAVLLGVWLAFRIGFALCSSGSLVCGVKPGTWALKLMMLVHHCIISPLALLAIAEDENLRDAIACFGCESSAMGLIADLKRGPLKAAQALVPVTMGYMVADLILLPWWNLSSSNALENCLMVLHHVISLNVWQMTMVFNYCQRYVLILLSYEFTSIFLTLMWILSTSGLKSSIYYKLIGLLFTASFVIVRMAAALPQLRAMWYITPWLKRWADHFCPGVIPDQFPAVLFHVGTATLVIPHLLNLFWGVKVVKGFVGVIVGGKKPKSEKAKQ